MDKKCCGNCSNSNYDKMNGYVCVSGDSDHCADFVEYDFVCDDWESGE